MLQYLRSHPKRCLIFLVTVSHSSFLTFPSSLWYLLLSYGYLWLTLGCLHFIIWPFCFCLSYSNYQLSFYRAFCLSTNFPSLPCQVYKGSQVVCHWHCRDWIHRLTTILSLILGASAFLIPLIFLLSCKLNKETHEGVSNLIAC